MIILITGVPGSGKTSSLVNMLMTDQTLTHYQDNDGETKSRIIYVNGIEELKLEHQPLTDEQIKEKPFQDYLPYASLIVIDEAQRLFPPRSSAAKIPPYIESLATHRHHGLDIILITQHPSFLDSFVRRLVQRHIHISIKPIGRKTYEWNECVDNPDSPTQISRATERQFILPKKAFEQYKSAEIHTKVKRRIPSMFYILGFVLIIVAILGNTVYHRMHERFGKVEESTEQAAEQNTMQPETQNSTTQSTTQSDTINNSLSVEMFVPTIPEKPESKPIYDNVRQVVAFEFPVACIKSDSGCRCYTEQATLIKNIPESFCEDYLKNGIFNPYKRKEQQITQDQPMNLH